MSVTFVKGANTLTFPTGQNREYPLSDKEAHRGKILRTAADVICVDTDRFADNAKTIYLNLKCVNQSFFDDIKDWFENKCEGKLYKFNYTNSVTGESALSVRWINGFDFSYDGLYYSGTITLEKEIE